jgi:hypothetical protein
MTVEAAGSSTRGRKFEDGATIRALRPKEIMTAVMDKADICRALYNAAEFPVFGYGSWPADREALAAFWTQMHGRDLR